MVENIEPLRTELQVRRFGELEFLRHAEVGVPGTRTTEGVPSCHIRGKGTEVGDSKCRVERCKIVGPWNGEDLKLIWTHTHRRTRHEVCDRRCRHNPWDSRVPVFVVGEVVRREGRTGAGSEDPGQGPAAGGLGQQPATLLEPRRLPYGRKYDPVFDVEIRAAPVEHGIGWIKVAQVTNVAGASLRAVGERGTQIVEGMSPGVVGDDINPRVMEVLRLVFHIE